MKPELTKHTPHWMTALNEAIKKQALAIIPFGCTFNGMEGRIIGRQLEFPLFRPNNPLRGDIEISWACALRIWDRQKEEDHDTQETDSAC